MSNILSTVFSDFEFLDTQLKHLIYVNEYASEYYKNVKKFNNVYENAFDYFLHEKTSLAECLAFDGHLNDDTVIFKFKENIDQTGFVPKTIKMKHCYIQNLYQTLQMNFEEKNTKQQLILTIDKNTAIVVFKSKQPEQEYFISFNITLPESRHYLWIEQVGMNAFKEKINAYHFDLEEVLQRLLRIKKIKKHEQEIEILETDFLLESYPFSHPIVKIENVLKSKNTYIKKFKK